MTSKKFDYTESYRDIFPTVIYPLYPKEFMFILNYEDFVLLISAHFILNDIQWQIIKKHWDEKENGAYYLNKE